MPASSPDESSTRQRLITGTRQALMTAGAAGLVGSSPHPIRGSGFLHSNVSINWSKH